MSTPTTNAHPAPEPAYHTLEQFRCIYHQQEGAVACEPFIRTFLQSHPPYGPMTEVTGLVAPGGGSLSRGPIKTPPVGQKWTPLM